MKDDGVDIDSIDYKKVVLILIHLCIMDFKCLLGNVTFELCMYTLHLVYTN